MNYEANKEKMNASSKLSSMTKEETLHLFEKFTGSLKVPADFNPKKEFLAYLDERYSVEPEKSKK